MSKYRKARKDEKLTDAAADGGDDGAPEPVLVPEVVYGPAVASHGGERPGTKVTRRIDSITWRAYQN